MPLFESFRRSSRSILGRIRGSAGLPGACAFFLALLQAGALAFDVEPAAPTRCDELVLVAIRSFTSDCGWSATAQVQQAGSTIDVALVLHAAGDICLPVAREKSFRIFLGSLPPGTYTISVAWSDLDQKPEVKEISIADAAVCPEKPRRGDANGDKAIDLSDPVFLLFHLFAGGKAPGCMPAADADADGGLGIADLIFILDFLFLSGPPPLALSDDEVKGCLEPVPFAISSASFVEGEGIPARYSCDGAKVSPPLAWSGAPAGTKSFALTCLDPDVTPQAFVHWLAWDIPAAAASLAESEKPPVEGTNGAGRAGYTGPCPPRGGGVHHYHFTLHALDMETLSLPTTTRWTDLEAALEGHVLATAALMGTYSRN